MPRDQEEKPGITVIASRLVWKNASETLRIRYESGRFQVENSAGMRLEIDPEAMDSLVQEWPKLRKMVPNRP